MMVKNKSLLPGQASPKKAKTVTERQAARRRRLKEDSNQYETYLMKQRELMKKKREKMTDSEKLARKSKETERRRETRHLKKASSQTPNNVNSPTGYSTESSLSRAVKRVDQHLPKSPGKRRAVVKELACKVQLKFSSEKKRLRVDAENLQAIEMKKTVIECYNNEEYSRWTPGKSEYVITKDTDGNKVKLQKKYLQMTCGELYQLFKEQHPHLKVGKSVFYNLRPCNILLSSQITHSTCHCKYHEIGKTKKEIEAAMKENDLESIFNNTPKIVDVSNIHVLEVVGDKYKTWKYSGIYL
jgi:hypothetical protein